MKKTTHVLHTKSVTHLAASLAVGLLCATASVGHAQNFPPGVQDVVKLSQAGVSDDVILTQIRNNQATYNLTADQIIALKDQGISSAVIKALMGGPAAPVAAPVSAPSPAPVAVVDTSARRSLWTVFRRNFRRRDPGSRFPAWASAGSQRWR